MTRKKLVEVICTQEGWTHQGKTVAVEETMKVRPDQAKRLEEAGLAAAVVKDEPVEEPEAD